MLAVTIVALINARRLRMSSRSQLLMAGAGAVALAGEVIAATLISGDQTPRLIRTLAALAAFGVFYWLQRSPERVYEYHAKRRGAVRVAAAARHRRLPRRPGSPNSLVLGAAVIDERTLAAVDRYLEMGRPEQALQALASLPAETAAAPHVRWLRAIAYIMQEDYARSADEARHGLEDAPDDPDLLRVLSAAEEQQGNLAEAEEAILAALSESPDSAGLLCQYAELLMRGGQLEKAGHLIDAAAAIDPDAARRARGAPAALLPARRRQAGARKHGEELLAHDPGSAVGQRMLGVLDFNRGYAGRAADRLGGVAGEYPSDYELGESARQAKAYRNPAWWPTRFFTRFGVWQTWIGVWLLLIGLRAVGLQSVALVILVVWFVLCAWSWIAPPILKRVAEARRMSDRLDGLRAAVELSPDNHSLRLVLAEALAGARASRTRRWTTTRRCSSGRARPARRRSPRAAPRSPPAACSSPRAAWRRRAAAARMSGTARAWRRSCGVALGDAGDDAPRRPTRTTARRRPRPRSSRRRRRSRTSAGSTPVKQAIHRTIVLPFQRPDLFERYGRKAGGGVLLYGPPGCGKTLLARATAGECGVPFLNVRIEDVLDPWLGVSEKQPARGVPRRPRTRARACCSSTSSTRSPTRAASSRAAPAARSWTSCCRSWTRSAPTTRGLLVLAATNAPWDVDDALKRPGRFDRVVFVSPPDEPARRAILELALADRPTGRVDLAKLAEPHAALQRRRPARARRARGRRRSSTRR